MFFLWLHTTRTDAELLNYHHEFTCIHFTCCNIDQLFLLCHHLIKHFEQNRTLEHYSFILQHLPCFCLAKRKKTKLYFPTHKHSPFLRVRNLTYPKFGYHCNHPQNWQFKPRMQVIVNEKVLFNSIIKAKIIIIYRLCFEDE